MDDNGVPSNVSSSNRLQEIFQRTQETQIERQLPIDTAGIVPVPRGSRGPRSLYIKRHEDSFGFTLRHFIVYPPDSVAKHYDGRHAAVGALLSPMDTIFVKNVKDWSPAKQAGLQRGDRLVAVNGVPTKDKTYSQVVQLIVNSPEYLHLLVVPKEEDVLQRFFAETAYNPVSNQHSYPDIPNDRTTAQQFLAHHLSREAAGVQVDAISWRSLQQPYAQTQFTGLQRATYDRTPRSADNLHYGDSKQRSGQQEIYAEIYPNEYGPRNKSRAAPQVPLYRKTSRRSSEGNGLSDKKRYKSPDNSGVNSPDDYNMKTMYKSNYEGANNYTNAAGCRLSLDMGRRESSSSLSSSIADGSKESLASFDSTSTLTGHETDDSAIMTRFRRSVQQKEEFLRMPSNTNMEEAVVRKEFYSRPNKLERQMWPPNEKEARTSKPAHQNVMRVKNDLENERDLISQQQNSGGMAEYDVSQQKGITSPKERMGATVTGVAKEAETAPSGYDSLETVNGAETQETADNDVRRSFHPGLQIVHKRAKDFESGHPLPEDDLSQSNKMNFSRSELSRLSSKKLVPNVPARAQEYDSGAAFETRRDTSGTSTNSSSSMLRRIQRDSRSLDSSGSNASSSSIHQVLSNNRLSGNVTISSGSKYLHCPPPDAYGDQPADVSSNETPKFHTRSNSADSWVVVLSSERNKEVTDRIGIQDAAITGRKLVEDPVQDESQPGELSPLIPESVQHIRLIPTLSVAPTSGAETRKIVRPNQLDLDVAPVRPMRHLKPPKTDIGAQLRRSISPNLDDKPVVVKRRPKNTNIADDERAMRRESYLKATEGGRMHIDSDLSDGGDISPQALRSAQRRWRPPLFPGDIQQLRKLFEDAASSLGGSVSSGSTASLDRDKTSGSPSSIDKDKYVFVREGMLHSKILEIDGKRSTDRSWKQALIVLKGPKLYLYKDRNYQSIGSIADSLEPSLSSGVDMRTSVVRVAEDYTKRKNVLRVSSVKPCRSEFLLQTENTEELAEWVKAFQEQVAASTDAELEPTASKQQAVPQLVPASTTIQVQGSHLSPQWNKQKVTSSRNRSPTGQSPVSKSRKPSQIADPATSPKTKTWRGRMVKQFRKFNQGGNSPSSPTAPEGSTFGVSLEDCLPSLANVYLPRFVEVCTEIIDARGLQTIGIYRVPGNNASITALTEEINKNYEEIPLEDPRWNDLHVVSSLLKSFFRKMPDSLITVQLYPSFIRADKIDDPKARMEELRKLVNSLPKHNYHTLKHIVVHLRRVADNSNVNKMEAKNLAIVFGPTIIRPEGDNMEHMVNHMTNQCKIVETLLTHADWFFPDNYSDKYMPVPIAPHEGGDDFETHHNQALLLHNISKYEALKDPKEKNGALLSSIISAAQRKVLRKPHKSHSAAHEGKDEPASPTNLAVFPAQTFSHSDLKESSCVDGKLPSNIPTTVMEIEQNKRTEKVPWFNYSTDKEEFLRRIENFKQETEAMLQLPRKTEISINNIDSRPMGQLSYSACNVSQNPRMSLMTGDNSDMARAHRSVNVYARNSLNLLDGPYSLQCDDRKSDVLQCCVASDNNRNGVSGYRDASDRRHRESGRSNLRRGSSAENVTSNAADASSGNMKKVKFENEINSQRTGSLDSLNKLANDDESLLSTMTKLIDEKLKEEHSQSTFPPEDIPFVDESPEKHKKTSTTTTTVANDKENILQASDLYRNPSLHKSQIGTSSRTYKKEEKVFKEKEKEEDTMATENVPDNDRHVGLITAANNKSATSSKLRRSESLNKPERTVSPMNKLKRSESLNKTGDKLKRSDSLSKTEKTENNNNKRRELSLSNRRFKDSTKNKRKNGMPDRSIKRRHTVGGTKDPDKITWLLDNKNQEEVDADAENLKEKNLRTSSPDLSSTRRDRFLFEINLIGPENMVVALRQHLIGTRPQSFPESTVFKVPLESHV